MAMSVNDFKTALLDGTDGSEDPADFGNAIADYVVDNAEISFSWNGIQPGSPPVVDPVTSTTGEIISCTIVVTQTGTSDHTASWVAVSGQISAGMAAAVFNVTEAGFAITGIPLAIPPVSISLSVDPDGDVRDQCYEQIAQQIYDWVTGFVNPTPLLGSHGSFFAPVGVGAIMTGIS